MKYNLGVKRIRASLVAQTVKNAPAVWDLGSIPGSGRSPEGGHATHSSILAWRIPIDRGAWQATVYVGPKCRPRLNS